MVEEEQASGRADRVVPPTILVVAADPKLLKLLHMALSLEVDGEVLTVDNARSAEEAARRLEPDLLILDEQLINHRAQDLSARLHRIAGLEQLPTLFLGVAVPSQMESHSYPTHYLGLSWKVEALYVAVWELLGHLP